MFEIIGKFLEEFLNHYADKDFLKSILYDGEIASPYLIGVGTIILGVGSVIFNRADEDYIDLAEP